MLLIVPASGTEARRHFEKTIMVPWNIEKIRELGIKLPVDVELKLRTVRDFRIWGAVPGSISSETWNRLEGYIVLFYREGWIVCCGRVIAKLHSRELAEKLWGRDSRGRTWEYVYFIGDLNWIKVPWEKVRELLGYSERFIPYGHTDAYGKVLKLLKAKGYSDVGELLEKELKIKCGVSRVSPRGFNPNELQLYKVGDELVDIVHRKLGLKDIDNRFSASVVLYGWAISSLVKHLGVGKISKDIVESLERELSESIRARLYNDLRRLGLISIGNSGNWEKGVDGVFTQLFRRTSKCLKLLDELGIVDASIYAILGVLTFIYCIGGSGEYGSEAGVCSKLKDINDLLVLDEGTRNVVREAIRLSSRFKEFIGFCIDYDARLWKIRELLSGLG